MVKAPSSLARVTLSSINEVIAVKGTRVFNTMWMFYAFAIYGALGAVFPDKQGPLLYWSNWIQLVSLPLIGVGMWLMGRASEQRAQETHDAVMQGLVDLQELVAALHAKVDAQPAGNR